MTFSSRILVFFVPFTLAACGVDVTPMVGTYHGNMVTGAVVDTNYKVEVADAGGAVEISGADFPTFTVTVMGGGDTFTSEPNDGENTLSWSGGELSVDHAGSDFTLTYSGSLDSGSGDGTGDGSGDGTGDGTRDGTGDDTDVAALVEGTYTGSITGPVVSAAYELLLTRIDAESVEASGDRIDPFEIPLSASGTTVDEAGSWGKGNFKLDGDSLSLTYDPQGIAFYGER